MWTVLHTCTDLPTRERWNEFAISVLLVSETRDFNYLNYAKETTVATAADSASCAAERYTFMTANLLQGLNIVGKIQNMTSALDRLGKVRQAMADMRGGSHISNMVGNVLFFSPKMSWVN